MSVAMLWNRFKSPFKTFIVMFLAVFQISFFTNLKPMSEQFVGHRFPNEIVDIDLSINDEVGSGDEHEDEDTSEGQPRIVRLRNGDVVNTTDIVPANFPPADRIVEAINNFYIKAAECVIRPETRDKFLSAHALYKEALATAKADPSVANKNAAKKAAVDIADSLVELGFLSPFRGSVAVASDNSSDLSGFNFERAASVSQTASNPMNSILLDKHKPEDLKHIGECHLKIMSFLPTNEEKKSYYEINIAQTYKEALANPSNTAFTELASQYRELSITADGNTNYDYAFNIAADTFIKAGEKVHSKLAEIQQLKNLVATNPSDTNNLIELQTAQRDLSTELLILGQTNKGQLNTYFQSKPGLLDGAAKDIDSAINYWMSQIASPGETLPMGSTPIYNTVRVPSTRETRFSATAGQQGFQNYDPNNLMLNNPYTSSGGIDTRRQYGNGIDVRRQQYGNSGGQLPNGNNDPLANRYGTPSTDLIQGVQRPNYSN